ncbi:MAG: HD domain-containing protein [Clostridia bacterium]|nr:HD domain-containing protein [Clostridia bacterium]
MENNYDFSLEKRLRDLSPDLHKRFTDTVFSLQHIRSNSKLIFPDYTDHSELHSLNVIDFCNRIIGPEIDRMNPDEIYCLLVACYFHDTGMGVTRKDYEAFLKEIDFGDYFETHDKTNARRIIRDFHNEFSGRFIAKYADLFDIPSKEHLRAIIQISRGHRKTALTDSEQYPIALKVPGSNTVCLPYLASVIRLSDEIDVTAVRNSRLLSDVPELISDKQKMEFKKHEAISKMTIEKERFVVYYRTDSPEVEDALKVLFSKMQKTLNECRAATNGRTGHEITQKEIVGKKTKTGKGNRNEDNGS